MAYLPAPAAITVTVTDGESAADRFVQQDQHRADGGTQTTDGNPVSIKLGAGENR